MTRLRCGWDIGSLRRIACSSSSLINLKCVDRPTLITIMKTCKKFHTNSRAMTINRSTHSTIQTELLFCAVKMESMFVPMNINWSTTENINETNGSNHISVSSLSNLRFELLFFLQLTYAMPQLKLLQLQYEFSWYTLFSVSGYNISIISIQ